MTDCDTNNTHEVPLLLDDIAAFNDENLAGVPTPSMPNPLVDLDHLSAVVERVEVLIRGMPPSWVWCFVGQQEPAVTGRGRNKPFVAPEHTVV